MHVRRSLRHDAGDHAGNILICAFGGAPDTVPGRASAIAVRTPERNRRTHAPGAIAARTRRTPRYEIVPERFRRNPSVFISSAIFISDV